MVIIHWNLILLLHFVSKFLELAFVDLFLSIQVVNLRLRSFMGLIQLLLLDFYVICLNLQIERIIFEVFNFQFKLAMRDLEIFDTAFCSIQLV